MAGEMISTQGGQEVTGALDRNRRSARPGLIFQLRRVRGPESLCAPDAVVNRMIRLKRVYETPSKDDGERILVERLWPRGLAKQRAKVDLWLKEVAPSAELRKWFGHDPAKWDEFRRR